MTVKELIAKLAMFPATAVVWAWDADSEEYEDVTGIVWSDEDDIIFIQTDDIS